MPSGCWEKSTMQRLKLTGVLCILAGLAVTVRAEVSPGEMRFAELNCAACHDGPPELKARLASRTSPKIGAEGLRLTPQWLKAFLADPQQVKAGTMMPDALHGLAAAEKTEAAEALTHYLISLQTPDKSRAIGFSTA